MKKLSYLLCLLVVFSLLVGCSSSENPPESQPDDQGNNSSSSQAEELPYSDQSMRLYQATTYAENRLDDDLSAVGYPGCQVVSTTASYRAADPYRFIVTFEVAYQSAELVYGYEIYVDAAYNLSLIAGGLEVTEQRLDDTPLMPAD